MTLWGGRFNKAPSSELWSFTVSHSDRRLLKEDILGSLAHLKMLGASQILPENEVASLKQALEKVLQEARTHQFQFQETDEDVHSAVERRVGELVGDLAGKLHTGRSRNDQVCLDLRMYLKEALKQRVYELGSFISILTKKAQEVGEIIVPAYTHLQQAQAVPLAHHLLAYAWMLFRDIERFQGAKRSILVSPLGAGAVGGSALPLNPKMVADELGFESVFENSIDAVASRDFVSEYAFCAAQALVHLSRLSEELILWNTKEFGWVTFDDRYTTGSSMLPQKKNPDIAELVRGKTSLAIGDLTSLLTLQKALPLSYNRDLQGDKELVFRTDDTLSNCLKALSKMMETATFHSPSCVSSFVTAIDLAEVLVERGVPFRQAHKIVGELILKLLNENRDFSQANVKDLEKVHPLFKAEDLKLIQLKTSVERRRSPGGGSFQSVAIQVKKILDKLKELNL